MIFNVSGGGGAALNFRVLAYATEAELLAVTPNENTIGIITETPITSWIFSATEPSSVGHGMVWIKTSYISSVEFNALKKNGIQVYPISAKQYIGGAWVTKTAKSWLNGEWKALAIYLYNKGDKFTDITGGWAGVEGMSDSSFTKGTFTDNGTSLSFSVSGKSNSASWRTANMVDLTHVSTIYVNVTQNSTGHTDLMIGTTSNYEQYVALSQIHDTSGVLKLNVADYPGSYYVMVHRHTNSSGGNAGSATFDMVWME